MVRVRFAPSPTGFLHIGGARTALFNWMYARSQAGQFILRIEDTDMVRSKQEYLDEIMDSMTWLGLNWDEFYKQSERFDIYRQYSEKLVAEGKAYKDGQAVLLKMAPEEIIIDDLIRGKIVFDTSYFYKRNDSNEVITNPDGTPVLKDEVLMKSDGSPSYNFACVVDDSLMEISHVIRGEDHISNTPKQIYIYRKLGVKPPKFAHLPLILDTEGGRMSKRAGATAVTEYRTLGFLPQAIVNYLMLLGWSPGNNQEKVAMSSALKSFSIKKINKAGAAFSLEKLQWLNSQYIKEMDTSALAALLAPLVAVKYPHAQRPSKDLEVVVQLYKGRMSTLLDFLDWTDFLFTEKAPFDQEAKGKHLASNLTKEFDLLAERITAVSDFNVKTAEEAFRTVVTQLGIEAGALVHPVRVALTGRAVGPGLFDTMVILGKDRTSRRLKECEFGAPCT